MAERYYAPLLPEVGGEAVLAGDEAQHLLRVMRAKAGAQVALFDGRGGRAAATLVAADRRSAALRIDSRTETPRPAGPTLGVALPKGDRASWLVEKGVELGLAELVPILAERGVAGAGESKLDKLRRAAVEACKQSGRDWLPELHAPLPLAEWLSAGPPGWLLHPQGEPLPIAGAKPARALIGPEGGWSPAEVEAAQAAGWRSVALPGHVLRVETAAAAFCAWWQWTANER
jgi:16S rRNA (uracil1498-N3)-methyltransferase